MRQGSGWTQRVWILGKTLKNTFKNDKDYAAITTARCSIQRKHFTEIMSPTKSSAALFWYQLTFFEDADIEEKREPVYQLSDSAPDD